MENVMHSCLNNEPVASPDEYWEYDAQGIELCKVCPRCRDQKLSRYRPEILQGYNELDVDEAIEPEPEIPFY